MPKKPSSTRTKTVGTKPRQLKNTTSYSSLRLSKRIKSNQPKLPPVRILLKQSLLHVWLNRKPFLLVCIVYGLLMLVFVRGFSGVSHLMDVNNNAQTSGTTTTTASSPSSLALFGVLLGGASATKGDVSSLYQTIIIVICSLAFIWLLRQTHEQKNSVTRARDAFYRGMSPLVPFIIILLVITLELIPAALANGLYTSVIVGNVALSGVEQALWYTMMFLLVTLSLYLISSSVFALYVSTLPNMTPMKALRSAHGLVQYRRWTVMRKLIAFPIIVMLVGAVIIIPMIAIAPLLAQWVFFLGTILFLPLLLSYIYGLYRVLL